MTNLESVEYQVQQLNAADFAKFREWFQGYEWQARDQEIEADSKAG